MISIKTLKAKQKMVSLQIKDLNVALILENLPLSCTNVLQDNLEFYKNKLQEINKELNNQILSLLYLVWNHPQKNNPSFLSINKYKDTLGGFYQVQFSGTLGDLLEDIKDENIEFRLNYTNTLEEDNMSYYNSKISNTMDYYSFLFIFCECFIHSDKEIFKNALSELELVEPLGYII